MAPVIVVAVVEVFVVVVVTKKCNPDEQKCKVEILYILKLFSLSIYIRKSNHLKVTHSAIVCIFFGGLNFESILVCSTRNE